MFSVWKAVFEPSGEFAVKSAASVARPRAMAPQRLALSAH
jgi:hypothetical protein